MAMTYLSSELYQLAYMALVVVFAVTTGQSAYQRAQNIGARVRKQVENRKRPPLRYVLYDMLWPPATLLLTFFIMRAGVEIIPPGEVAAALTTVLNVLLIVTLCWFAVRIVRGVINVADTSDES